MSKDTKAHRAQIKKREERSPHLREHKVYMFALWELSHEENASFQSHVALGPKNVKADPAAWVGVLSKGCCPLIEDKLAYQLDYKLLRQIIAPPPSPPLLLAVRSFASSAAATARLVGLFYCSRASAPISWFAGAAVRGLLCWSAAIGAALLGWCLHQQLLRVATPPARGASLFPQDPDAIDLSVP
ncbi:hypothetical protein Scep_016206 [Stephania cephalantha]|uniref:Uncharacterized protein n=1 Tax=Stephania cephalantha TaxID=152367 RepID=A0AAP0IND0_9MAGN